MVQKTAEEAIRDQMGRLLVKMGQNSTELGSQSKCRFCAIELPDLAEDDRLHCAACCHERVLDAVSSRKNSLTSELQSAGVPPKFIGVGVDLPAWATSRINQRWEITRGFFLHGATGVGKTTILTAFIEHHALGLLERGMWSRSNPYRGASKCSWRYEGFSGFMLDVQRAFKRENEDAYEFLDFAVNAPLLALDDLGATKATDFVRQAVYHIVNEREAWERPTFITSNFSLAELNDQFDPRISSRIAGMCDVIELKGKDRRLNR